MITFQSIFRVQEYWVQVLKFRAFVKMTSIVLEQRGISIIAIGLNATVYSLAVLLTGPYLPTIIHRIGLLKSMFAGALLSGAFVCGCSHRDDKARCRKV